MTMAMAKKRSEQQATGEAASRLIDERIQSLGDWRGQTLARMRKLILEAAPAIIEEWKWMGTPVWSRDGLICTGESYQKVVKLTFAKGASLEDPAGLFNSSLGGNMRRAIDIPEGAVVDAKAFKTLVKAAVALNGQKTTKKKTTQKSTKTKSSPRVKPAKAKAPARAKRASKKPAR